MIVKLKKEFEDELRRLRVKKAYVENTKKYYGSISVTVINGLNECKDFRELIHLSFIFHQTKEGVAFWSMIADGRHASKLR